MASFSCTLHQPCDLPCLCSPVAEVAIPGVGLVRGVKMRAEDFDDRVVFAAPLASSPSSFNKRFFGARQRHPDPGAGYALADEPVAPEEGRWPAVQRVPEHGALFDGPCGEDG